jgi:hypothetical protein
MGAESQAEAGPFRTREHSGVELFDETQPPFDIVCAGLGHTEYDERTVPCKVRDHPAAAIRCLFDQAREQGEQRVGALRPRALGVGREPHDVDENDRGRLRWPVLQGVGLRGECLHQGWRLVPSQVGGTPPLIEKLGGGTHHRAQCDLSS